MSDETEQIRQLESKVAELKEMVFELIMLAVNRSDWTLNKARDVMNPFSEEFQP